MEENKVFNFHIHRKVEIWVDEEINVTAKDVEHAKRIASQFVYTREEPAHSDDSNVDFIGSEFILESQKNIDPEHQKGLPTIELYYGNASPQNLVMDNGIK